MKSGMPDGMGCAKDVLNLDHIFKPKIMLDIAIAKLIKRTTKSCKFKESPCEVP